MASISTQQLIEKAQSSEWTNEEVNSLKDALTPPAPAKSNKQEIAELTLTGFLGLAFLISLWYVFQQVGKIPVVYQVGEENRVVEPLQQSLMAIAILTPFFTTIVGFWFGKSSGNNAAEKEAERADKVTKDKETTVDKARKEKEAAEKAAKIAAEAQAQAEKDRAQAEKDQAQGKLRLNTIQGLLTLEKNKAQKRTLQQANAIAPKIAREQDRNAIVSSLAGTLWERVADSGLLAEESSKPEIVKYLTSLEGDENITTLNSSIQAVLNS